MDHDNEAQNCITPRFSYVQSLMKCGKACMHRVMTECMKMKTWFETCCNIMAIFLRNEWNNIKGSAKALLGIIVWFLKSTWTECKKIFTTDRVVALFALGMEVASATLEKISSGIDERYPNHRRFYLMALLAAGFSLLGLIMALLEMIHSALSSRRWINWTLLCVNIAFALAQATTSLVHFTFLQFYGEKDPIEFSILPILFALIVFVSRFITHQSDTIEGQLVCGNHIHNVIVEKVDGNYVIHCTSMLEPC